MTVYNSDDQTVMGNNHIINGDNCTVVGNNCVVNGDNCVVSGNNNVVNGDNCVVKGQNNIINGLNGVGRNGGNQSNSFTRNVSNGISSISDGVVSMNFSSYTHGGIATYNGTPISSDLGPYRTMECKNGKVFVDNIELVIRDGKWRRPICPDDRPYTD